MKILKIFFIVILFGCFTSVQAEEYNKEETLYSMVDRLSLREKPGLKTTIIGYLAEGEPIVYSGKKSSFKTRFRLKDKSYNEYWFFIKRNQVEGWVYGGLVSSNKPDYTKVKWRTVIVYDGQPANDQSEDWGWFTSNVYLSCSPQGIIMSYKNQDDKAVLKLGSEIIKTIDLKEMIRTRLKDNRGYLLIEKGKKPVFIAHDMPQYVLKKIAKYFGFTIALIRQ